MNLATLLKGEFDIKLVRLIDIFGSDYNYIHSKDYVINKICSEVKKYNPKILAINTTCSDYHISLQYIKEIKKNNDIFVILGGPQASATAIESLEQFSLLMLL